MNFSKKENLISKDVRKIKNKMWRVFFSWLAYFFEMSDPKQNYTEEENFDNEIEDTLEDVISGFLQIDISDNYLKDNSHFVVPNIIPDWNERGYLNCSMDEIEEQDPLFTKAHRK